MFLGFFCALLWYMKFVRIMRIIVATMEQSALVFGIFTDTEIQTTIANCFLVMGGCGFTYENVNCKKLCIFDVMSHVKSFACQITSKTFFYFWRFVARLYCRKFRDQGSLQYILVQWFLMISSWVLQEIASVCISLCKHSKHLLFLE